MFLTMFTSMLAWSCVHFSVLYCQRVGLGEAFMGLEMFFQTSKYGGNININVTKMLTLKLLYLLILIIGI